MKTVDEIIYDAILASEGITDIVGDRVVSTCFEVPPEVLDNTLVPNIIVTFDGFQNQTTTKDTVWEGEEDRVQVGVDIAAGSPGEVKHLVRMVRTAVESHVVALYQQGEDTPELEALSSDGIAWDWMKPCYYQKLNYQCLVKTDIDDEQQEEN